MKKEGFKEKKKTNFDLIYFIHLGITLKLALFFILMIFI